MLVRPADEGVKMRRRYPSRTAAMQTILDQRNETVTQNASVHLLVQSPPNSLGLVALVFLAFVSTHHSSRVTILGTHILNLPPTPLIQRVPHAQQRITQRLRRTHRGPKDDSRRMSRQRPCNTHATTLFHDLRRNRNHRVAGSQQIALKVSRRTPQASAHTERLIRVVGHSARFFIGTGRVGASPVLVLGARGAVRRGAGLVGVEESFCALEEGLGTDCNFGAEAGDLRGCVLGKRVHAFLQAAHDAAVFLVLAHWDDDKVAHAGADVDEGTDSSEAGEHAGKLVALHVRHPDIVESLIELVEGGDTVDDGVAEGDVRAIEDEEVHEFGSVTGADAAVIYTFGLVIEFELHRLDF